MLYSGYTVPRASLICEGATESLPAPKKQPAGVWMPDFETSEYVVQSDRYDLQIAVLIFDPVDDFRHSEEEQRVPDLLDRIYDNHQL